MMGIAQAAAHAQKHSERRQQSESYDQERDTRLVKAAFDCTLNCRIYTHTNLFLRTTNFLYVK